MQTRIQKEKEFHNKRFSKETREQLDKYYAVSPLINKYFDSRFEEACKGKVVLEYGCGLGDHAFKIAGIASRVHAIDISEVAIAKAKEIAKRNSVNNVSFYVMNAEELNFSDNYFDAICGIAILHHLDLNSAFKEITRVLKKDGKIFFIEPMGHNPIINYFRNKTSHLRTEDEHPFLKKDLELLDKYFMHKNIRHFNLLSLLSIPFRNKKSFLNILKFLTAIDKVLFKVKFFRYQSWHVVIECSAPKKLFI